MNNAAKKALIRAGNKLYGPELEEIPEEQWPQGRPTTLIRALRSNRFLVQITTEEGGLRLSVIRCSIGKNGWMEGITWDELQAIKQQCGYGEWFGVEIYPRDQDVVNVANMRHIWIFEEPLKIGWFRKF